MSNAYLNNQTLAVSEPDGMTTDPRPYKIGTLSYSLAGVILVGFWLILGGCCFSLMAWIMVPTVLPLVLKEYNASAAVIGFVVGSLPAAMNAVMNPILSTASDRTRSRWGRRRPYLLFATPFVALFVILLGWMPQFAEFLHARGWDMGFPLGGLVILLVAVCAVIFQFFDLIVGSVYYYLAPDVIPIHFFGRFMAATNIAGTLTTLVFNLYVLPLVKIDVAWVFTGVGIAYFAIFMLMCAFVKEGEYPPVVKYQKEQGSIFKRTLEWIIIYCRQCYRQPFFFLLFLGFGLHSVSTTCRSVFNLLFATEDLQMTVEQFGKVGAVGALVSLGIIFIMGFIVDRFPPIILYLFSTIPILAANIWGYFFTTDYLSFFAVGIAISVVYAIQSVCGAPLGVMLFPKEKYGQFCSANAIVRSLLLIAGNYLGGLAIDFFGYRFIFIWDTIFTIIATLALIYVYIKWKQYGGAEHYQPPNTD